MANYHGELLNINNDNINKCNKLLPKRNEFLNKVHIEEQVNKINNFEDIYFLGNDTMENLPFQNYILSIAGILKCGSKAVIDITGIHPYVDVKINQENDLQTNMKYIKDILSSERIKYDKINIVTGKDLFIYSMDFKQYMRVYFYSIYNRKKFINILTDRDIETYNNELSCYYRLVAREYKLNLSSWNVLSNYIDIKSQNKYKSEFQFSVDINDIKPLDDEIIRNDQCLFKDKLISACFDIEMYTPDHDRIPSGKYPGDILFMLCITFQYINEPNSFLNICLVTTECDQQDNLFTIVCEDEYNLLKLFGKIMNSMQPDFITEFNGSNFDWKVIVDKAMQFNLLKFICKSLALNNMEQKDMSIEDIEKWRIKSERIKLDATNFTYSYNINSFGYIAFDTRIIFRKLYPLESKSSLNFYLGKLGLASKDEMDFRDMFNIFLQGPSNEMARVAHYCYIDSYRLHELLLKKNVFKDKRELAVLSYTNMYDSFYRADGIRVRNLIISNCLDQGLFYNNIIKESEERTELKGIKYPGALVLDPIKGLVSNMFTLEEFLKKEKIIISDQDLKLLYIVIEDNYDSIFLKTSSARAIDLSELTEELIDNLYLYIDYVAENEIKYPVSGLDFSSLYPSIIMAYNLSPEFLILDSDDHDAVKNKVLTHDIKFSLSNINKEITAFSVLTDVEQNRETGLYPSILIDLFNKRLQVKRILAPFSERLEEMDELEKSEPGKWIGSDEYNECQFNFNYYNAKQAAIKVFMNTFYGETGNTDSPLFLLPIAGGITSAGQYNLKLVKHYIETELDVKVYYGDSVTGDTPIIIKINNTIKIMAIKDLNWSNMQISNNKEIVTNTEDIEVYTEDGFTPIIKFIRHKTNKKLFRITTNSGIITVTEDHSLLNLQKEKIMPNDCEIGTDLLHWKHIIYKNNNPIYNDIVVSYTKSLKFSSNDLVNLQTRYLILLSKGYTNITIDYNNETNEYDLEANIADADDNTCYQIKKIEYIGESDDYVYDLETKSHHFAAGIGKLVVHNTDSLYISCPRATYADLDQKYYTNKMNKLDYNTKLVEYTFKDIDRIKILVNELLTNDNGTKYLKMAYEEVLFPVAFLSKKKYYGLPHQNIVNFKPSKLFIRGLDMKKRGISQLLIKICSDILWKSMDLENNLTLKEIVIKHIEILFTTKWDNKDFIKSSVWKPSKQNIRVHTFVNRMKTEGKAIPSIGGRFNYIVVKRYPFIYDITGKQTKISVGDKMEYPDVVEVENLDIDLLYYFGNELTGQFARLISYDKTYEVYKGLELDDTATFNACKKAIEGFADLYNNSYKNVGHIYKKLYKTVADKIEKTVAMPKRMQCITKYSAQTYAEFIFQIKQDIEMSTTNTMANNIIKKNKNVNELYKMYSNKKYVESYYSINMKRLLSQFNNHVETLFDMMTKKKLLEQFLNYKNNNIKSVINHIKEEYQFDKKCIEQSNTVTQLDEIISVDVITQVTNKKELFNNSINKEDIESVYTMLINVISTYKMIVLNKKIKELLSIKKNKAAGIIEKPSNFKY